VRSVWLDGRSSLVHTPDMAKESILKIIASFMDGRCKRVATSSFVTVHTIGWQVFAFCWSYERPPVSLYQFSIVATLPNFCLIFLFLLLSSLLMPYNLFNQFISAANILSSSSLLKVQHSAAYLKTDTTSASYVW